jgi:predicted MFS family arabinose efflux permease
MLDWRVAFFIVGLAGIALAPIFRLTVREPVRGGFDRQHKESRAPGLKTILLTLSRKPSFWLISLGASSSSMMGYGIFFWLPSFLVRSFELTLLSASLHYGGVLLVGGLAGIWAGGWLGDRFGQIKYSRYVNIPALGFLCAIPFYVLAMLSSNQLLTMVLLLIPTALSLMWLGPVISVIQHLVRPDMRATASAVFLFINNLIGIGVGTFAIGLLSDALQLEYGNDSLRYSILAGNGFYLVAASLFYLASKRLEKDWD